MFQPAKRECGLRYGLGGLAASSLLARTPNQSGCQRDDARVQQDRHEGAAGVIRSHRVRDPLRLNALEQACTQRSASVNARPVKMVITPNHSASLLLRLLGESSSS